MVRRYVIIITVYLNLLSIFPITYIRSKVEVQNPSQCSMETSRKLVIRSKAKSRKYQGVFEVKSRVKTWQVRGIWSQHLEHKQVQQWGTEPGVRKGKRSLLACHSRSKCSMETTHNRWRSSSVSMSWFWWKVWLVGKSLWSRISMSFNIRERDTSYCWIRSPYRP